MTAVANPPSAPAVAEPPPTVEVGLEDLIVGRAIQFPIHDSHGVLLLGEGLVITPEFMRKLRERGIVRIRMHANDAVRATLDTSFAEITGSPFTFDNELTKKLDTLIDSGNLFVANTGPAMKDSRVMHGCKAYDAAKRGKLIEEHAQASKSLDGMMKSVIQGRRPNVSELNTLVGTYLAELPQDADNVLSLASEVSREGNLADHCLEMSVLGMGIGVEMGLDAGNVRNIGLVAMVHDWAMLRVPAHIRNAPRALSDVERLEIKKHPIYSLDFLERITGLPTVVPLVSYQIHERLNGSGYPRGKSGKSIHLFARILAVADAFIAMTRAKTYRKAFKSYSAMEQLLRDAAQKLYDAEVVRHLINLMSLFPVGSFVTLSDGSVARVIRRNGNLYTTPIVQLLQDNQGRRYPTDDPATVIDLSTHSLKVNQALPTPGREEMALRP